MNLLGLRTFWIGCALIAAFGCAAAPTEPAPATATSGAEEPPDVPAKAEETPDVVASLVADEHSVRPGINTAYFRADALTKYTKVLEAESREVVERQDEILDAIGLREGMVVADIGAGTGFFTSEIAKRVGNRGAVFSVDIVPSFLERIRERVNAEKLTNVTVVQGEERATGLKPASVDLAFICATYHHIEYPRAYMHSLLQTLRPGGTLVLIDFERIEGKTNPVIIKHVRAGKETVIGEVSQAGFVFESETELLDQNYYLRFSRP